MKTSTQTAQKPAAKVNTFSKSDLIKAIKAINPDFTEESLKAKKIVELKVVLKDAELQAKARTLLAKHEQPKAAAPKKATVKNTGKSGVLSKTIESLKNKPAAKDVTVKELKEKATTIKATVTASKFKVTAKPELVKSVIPTIKSELRAAAYKVLAKKGELTVDQVYVAINKHCECNRKQVAVALQNLITLHKVARV